MARQINPSAPDASDVHAALLQLATDAHAQVLLTLRPSLHHKGIILVRVEFRALEMELEADPVHVHQEALDTRRRIDMASALHRIVQSAWATYHNTPWCWTGAMRRAHVRQDA